MLCRLVSVVLLGAALAACQNSKQKEAEEKLIDLYMGNAQIYFDGQHYRSALTQAEEVLALDPEHTKARFVRAMSKLNMGTPQMIQEACGEFESLVTLDFENRQWKVWIGLSMARAAVGDLYDARARKLLAEMKNEPFSKPELGPRRDAALKKRAEFWRKSIEGCKKVLSYEKIPLARNDPTALYYLYRNHSLLAEHEAALVYELRHLSVIEISKKTWEDCLEKFRSDQAQLIYKVKLKGARRQEIAVREMMANTYYKLNRLEEAEDSISQVIMLDPLNLEAFVNRAQINRKLGHHDLAVADLNEFLKKTRLDETDPRALEVVDLLRDSQAKMLED
jgi:Tfp pilus assembly protein PilF